MSDKTVRTCLKAMLMAVFLLFVQTGFAQKNYAELEKTLESRKAALGTDFAAVVVLADTIQWQKTWGDLPPKTPVELGPASQWFTTAVILQLVDEGKLSLDDKVSKYLPVFELYRKNYITIRHCLSHQSGIRASGGLFTKKKFATLDEEATGYAKREIDANAGEAFGYSQIGPAIAGRIAEIVTKKKFDVLVKQRLFTPLTMRTASFSTPDASAPDAAAGARGTATDYARFLQMLLAGGKYGGKQILSEAAVAEMRHVQITKAQVKTVLKGTEGWMYGLGSWDLGAGVMACPGFNGVWPVVDFSRGYALLILPKKEVEGNGAAVMEVKAVADKVMARGKK